MLLHLKTIVLITNMTIMAVMAIISVMHEMVILGLMVTMAVIPTSTVMVKTSLKFFYSCNDIYFFIGSSSCIDYNWL